MKKTIKRLKIQHDMIISQINTGQEKIITDTGKVCAKTVSGNNKQNSALEETDNELFGMWKDREDMEDVEQYVRNMRKGRKLW